LFHSPASKAGPRRKAIAPNGTIQFANNNGLSSNVNFTYLNSILSLGNSSVNATMNSTTFSGVSLTANNATNLGGTAAAGYQTTAGLSSNVATLTANNATNLGGVAAASYINTSGSYVITGFHTYGNLTMNVVVTNTSVAVGTINSTAVGILVANNLLTIGNSSVNVTANSTTFSGISLTANNATNLGGVTSGSYINTSGSYVITGFHTYGNSTMNVIVSNISVSVGTINSTAVGILVANNLLTIGNSSVNSTMNSSTLSIATVSATTVTANYAGNGSSLTSITSASNLTATGTSTGAIPLSVVGAASATANLFQVSNSGSVIFAINSVGVAVGNGFGLTSVTASVIANSGIVSNNSGIFANIGTGLSFVSGAITATATGSGYNFGQI